MRRCTLRLMRNWSILTAAICLVVVALCQAFMHRTAGTNTMYLLTDTKDTIRTPLQLSRWWDPLFLVLPTSVWVWMVSDFEQIKNRWATRHEDFEVIIVAGFITGAIAAGTVPFWGFVYLAIASAVVMLICIWSTAVSWNKAEKARRNQTLSAGSYARDSWKMLSLPLAGSTIMMLVDVPMRGAVQGSIYALGAFAVCTLTLYLTLGLLGLGLLVKPTSLAIARFFDRHMLSNCDHEDAVAHQSDVLEFRKSA